MSVPTATMCELLERYDLLLLDAFGVLVNQQGVLPEARGLIEQLHARDHNYLILTNDASRLPQTRAAWYADRGMPIDSARIVTSGALVADWFAANQLSGARCVVLGPPDSKTYVEQAGGIVIDAAPDADAAVLVLGDQEGYPLLETINDVLTLLFRRIDAGHRIRLLQPNPDLVFPSAENAVGMAIGGVAVILEAALAQRYPGREDLRFERLGKPHRPIFERAATVAGPAKMLMIGDQLQTDIAGANEFGISSALVTTGVARSFDSFPNPRQRPTYILESLLSGLETA